MTTTPIPPIDVDLLRSEIRKTYAAVSQEPEREFIFPTGRSWAEDLDYPTVLANVPDAAVESFAGVANPVSLGSLEAGERVLDVGSGAGTDSLVAAQMVGPTGSVTGIDMTPEMLEKFEHGNLVATYMRSTFEDTRQKALKFGANGATVKAFKRAT